MTDGQRHKDNITSGQFGRTIRHSSLLNKKIKTPQSHKKNLNVYGNHTSGTLGFAAPRKTTRSKNQRAAFLPTHFAKYYI